MSHLDLTLVNALGGLAYAALKATMIVAFAAGLTLCQRRRSAAARHMVWTVSLGCTILVLLLPMVLPAWHIIPVPLEVAVGPRTAAASPEIARRVGGDAGRAGQHVSAIQFSSAEHQADLRPNAFTRSTAFEAVSDHWPLLVFFMWIAGVLVVLARYWWSNLIFRRVLRRATILQEGGCASLFRQVARQMQMTRIAALVMSDEVDLPVTYGILTSCVVLPREASEWTQQRCRYVLHHELAHVKRLDGRTQLVAHFASAIFWFHPLIWYAGRQMRYERERACDDYVLAQGALASDYATDLLAIVNSHGYSDEYPTVLAMARRSHFEERLLALLDPKLERRVVSAQSVFCGVIVAIALVLPLAAVQGAGARTAQSTFTQSVDPPTFAVQFLASPVPARAPYHSVPNAPQVRMVPAGSTGDIFAGCGSKSARQSGDHIDSDRDLLTWKASGSTGGCSFELNAEGEIAFNKDVTALARISPGGFMSVATDIRGEVTRLEVRPSSGGTLTYVMTRNGMPLDFSKEGPAWFAGFWVGLDRHTAFAIDSRFPKLLRDGGPSGVLDEVGRMYTDHTKGVYLTRLIEHASLGPDDLRRALEMAAALTSGYETGRMLVTAAEKFGLSDEAVRSAFVEATLAIRGDANRGRALSAFLQHGAPTREQFLDIVASSAKMQSGNEKARILIALAAKEEPDGELLDAYLRSAQTILSDFERKRVLAAVGH